MSRRRCCCTNGEGGYPCQPCPSPISPATTREWRLTVIGSNILGDSAGSGMLAGFEDSTSTCARGACGRVSYQRWAFSNEDFSCYYDCEDVPDATSAPTQSGSHVIRWAQCSPIYPMEDCGFGYCPDIENEQDGAVAITGVIPNIWWDFTNCTYSAIVPDGQPCCTVVVVEYKYNDAIPWDWYHDTGNGCEWTTQTVNMFTQTWTAYYARNVQPGEYFAEGSYNLVRLDQPQAYPTKGPNAGTPVCQVPAVQLCASSMAGGITPTSTWQPPGTITVVRHS